LQRASTRFPNVNLVQPGSFLTLHYRLAGPDGADVVSTFGAQPATLSLGSGQLAPAIEARLLGLAEGARQTIELPAGAAYGDRNPELLQRVKLSLLHELGDPDAEYTVGDVVQFPTPDGQAQYAGVVREAGGQGADAWLLFDFNHPLAGQPVRFEVQLLGVL
jgi:FKBP-type peptidyl-prolyl cis-trans isomerase SlpA